MKQSEAASPSFLFDLTKLLLADSGLSVNLQVRLVFQVVQYKILSTAFSLWDLLVMALFPNRFGGGKFLFQFACESCVSRYYSQSGDERNSNSRPI